MTLEVFVATRLANPLNRREHWAVRAKRAKVQRLATFLSFSTRDRTNWPLEFEVSRMPKRIAFLAHVARKMDTDGLSASLKACRDGLIDAGLIHDDGPDSGHVFEYAQVVAKPLGVRIRVARR